MCQFETTWEKSSRAQTLFQESADRLLELEKDNLVKVSENSIEVSDLGRIFIRNICMALDDPLWKKKTPQLFSKAI